MHVTHLNQLMWTLIKNYGWPIDYVRVSDVEDSSERAQIYRKHIAEFLWERTNGNQT